MNSLVTLLGSSIFLNSGRVTKNDSFINQVVDCLYLEPENVTLSRNVWATSTRIGVPQKGPCTFVFSLTGTVPPIPNCTAQNLTPGYDRPGADYAAVPVYATYEECENACCNDAHCASWAFLPKAAGPYLGCHDVTQPCCYLKSASPPPTPSSLPGLISGARPSEPPAPVAFPPSGMRSAVPLGGLGCGSFEIRADGTIHEWTLNEASPAGNAKMGTVADMMLGVRVGDTARALRTSYLGSAFGEATGVDALTYRGSYPLSRLDVEDFALTSAAGGNPSISLNAYSRFEPGNLNGSALPAVSFTLLATNPSPTESLEVSLFLSLPLSGFNDCWGASGQPTVTLNTSSPGACNKACTNASTPFDCAAWYWDVGTGVCTMDPFLFLTKYKQGTYCGFKSSWASDTVNGAPALTLSQMPHECSYSPGVALSPWCGNYTLTASPATGAGVSAATSSFSTGDDLSALWREFSAGSFSPVTEGPNSFGAGLSTMTLAPGATGSVTLVFAWYLPHRDFLGEMVGAYYQNLYHDSNSVASVAADPQMQLRTVADINSHHATYAGAGSSTPTWLADVGINSYSHMRNAFHMADGRWRQFEAFDCVDMDSVHNDFQRHLPYLWSFPELEAQKSKTWASMSKTYIVESMTTGCLAPPGPLDRAGGRQMGDVSTIWALGVYELYVTGALGDKATALLWIQAIWPSVKAALQWQLEQCSNPESPGLPHGLVCTYDIEVLEKYPTTAYNSFLHLAMMKAVGSLAELIGDAATADVSNKAFSNGLASMHTLLWNSTVGAFRAFSTRGSPSTMPIMADCLYGASIAHSLGLGLLWDGPATDFKSHLASEAAFNANPYGLVVLTGRDGPMPFASIDLTTWGMAGPTYGYVGLASGQLGPVDALDFARRFMDNARSRISDQWNLAGLYSGANWTAYSANDDAQPWCTNHYGMPLTHYYLHYALSGQQANIPEGRLSFSPAFPAPFRLPFFLAGASGNVSQDEQKKVTLSIAFGTLTLPAGGLSVNGKVYPQPINMKKGDVISW